MKPIIKFISEARTELMKVNWPTRQTAVNLTLTVIGVSLAFSLYIAGVDLLLTEGVKWVTDQGADEANSPIQVPPININDLDLNATPVPN